MKTIEEKSKFTLPKEVVIVKYIHRKKGMAAHPDIKSDHVISGGMLNGSVRKFYAPLQRNGSIKNVLNDEEKEYLEQVTGLNLSVYGDFWTKFCVSLYKEEGANRFDLSDPMSYISIKILESLDKYEIAPRWADRNKNLTYQFVITRENEEMLETKGKYDAKKEAFKLYGKLEDDKDKLFGVLKLLTNKPLSQDSKLDWLQHKVEELIDNDPKAFVNVVNDKAFYTKLLINTAVDKGVIVKKSNKYSTVDGLELAEAGESPTFDNAVKYLDTPKHQEIRMLIEAKLTK